jgi:glycosyltransferase involved in cell wall biosynthesis
MAARVLQLTKGLGRGGAERLLVGGIAHLDPDRYECEVAYLLPWKDALVPDLEAAGVPVHLLECRRPFDPRWLGALRELVRERHFDLVHTHMPYVGIGARLALRGTGVPLVHTEHNVWSRYRIPTRQLNMLTIGRNRRVIAVSSAVAESMTIPRWAPVELPPVDVVVHGADRAHIPSGQAARAVGRERLGIADTIPVIGTVGNFTAKKAQGDLLLATAELVLQHAELKLVLVGSGPLESTLRSQVEKLGLDRNVIFTGMRDDVYELLPAFDVFVLSSRFEGLPISLLEAMAAGVPTVATRVGGIPEVIVDGVSGLLVDAGLSHQLAKAIGEVLDDTELASRLATGALARSARFDLAHAVEQTERIYEQVLAAA